MMNDYPVDGDDDDDDQGGHQDDDDDHGNDQDDNGSPVPSDDSDDSDFRPDVPYHHEGPVRRTPRKAVKRNLFQCTV